MWTLKKVKLSRSGGTSKEEEDWGPPSGGIGDTKRYAHAQRRGDRSLCVGGGKEKISGAPMKKLQKESKGKGGWLESNDRKNQSA